ncbi:MAG: hypothetical protein ABJL44_03245 [Algibacter sp.]
MKTKISILALVFLTVLSCNELDKLTEFDITEDFDTTLNISIPDNSEGMEYSFEETTTIDIASNEDIQENLDLIENVTLNALTYEISNFDGAEDTTITEASINFADINISVADINLKEADTNNTVFDIIDAEKLEDIANTLKSNNELTVTLTGTISDTPATFDIIIILDTTFTIDVI